MYLEEQIHKIYNPNTRDYMKEVYIRQEKSVPLARKIVGHFC